MCVPADPKPGAHGAHHANDYRPDPTRADRIRGSGDKDQQGGGSGGRSKNGHPRSSSSAAMVAAASGASLGQSPSHLQGRNIRGQIVVALYSYQGSECGDMSFQKGDQMEILDDT